MIITEVKASTVFKSDSKKEKLNKISVTVKD